jgi:molecular chaperone Hsp33
MKPENQVDLSIPFLLPDFSMRGNLVRLSTVSTQILTKHTYPPNVENILCDLLAAGAALSGLLKYEGIFTLQTKTSGPIGFAVVDVTHNGHLRGYVQVRDNLPSEKSTFKELLGRGYLTFTVDQGLKVDRYQGIVSLNHESLIESLEHYFEQSEQTGTKIFLASEKNQAGEWKCGALVLQQLPTKVKDGEPWDFIEAILKTLSPQEFLNFETTYETLLYRLFNEVGVQVFEPKPLIAQCRCSKERIRTFLSTLKTDEIEELLEKGQLKMTCEFCNHVYTFDRKDLMTVH